MFSEAQTKQIDCTDGRCDPDLDRLESSRVERLVRFSDYCTSAKDVADSMGETFLAYMMAMSIQAARLEMRPKIQRAKP